MNDQNQDIAPGPSGDWRQQRYEERMKRRQDRMERRGRHNSSWLWGGFLILLGVALLMENMGFIVADNWWALFILIPAFGSFASAWDRYRDNQRLTRGAARALVGGLSLTVLTLVLFFSIDLGMSWPFLLILAGLALISVGLIPA